MQKIQIGANAVISNDDNIREISLFIAENNIFESLSRPVIRSIASKLQLRSYRPNEVIMSQGEIGDSFYIIREGHVKAVICREGEDDLVLSEMGLGEGFGELALLTNQPRSCTVKAMDNVLVLVLTRDDFQYLYERFPELALKFNELQRQRVSLLESEELNESALSKFLASRNRNTSMDYSMLDLLMKLNEAAGGPEQVEHCKETGQLAREMSKILCPMVSEELLFAGYLHEIGKVSVPRELVLKERHGEPLYDEERSFFDHIFTMATDILAPDKILYERLNFLRDLDSNDYHDMRLEAQILKVANDFLELRSPSYRGLSIESSLETMKSKSGTLYNPRVITSLCKNIEKFQSVRVEAQLNVLRMMVLALDRKDNYTYRHSVDVRNIASILADRLNLDRQSKRFVEIGSELHDVGKIFIDERILNAPRRLTDSEFAIMKTHAQRSADFFADIYGMDELAMIVGSHHEKYNGQGYPRGLAGEDIPYIARIMAIADVWSALTTPRVYRLGSDGKPKGMPADKAFAIMEDMASQGHFDPAIFSEFTNYIQENILNTENANKTRDLPDKN